jgi:hypothetical protein
LACLPSEWDLSATMVRYDNAPPLQSLIDAAKQYATSTTRAAPGVVCRPDAIIARNHAAALTTVVDASFPVPPQAPVAAVVADAPANGTNPRKRQAGVDMGSNPKRAAAGSRPPRPAPYCYQCNADGHLSPQCRAVGYNDKTAFKPVNGQRPLGGLRGKLTVPRVGLVDRRAPATSTSVADHPPSFSGFQFDLYDDDDMSRLEQLLPMTNKPDE